MKHLLDDVVNVDPIADMVVIADLLHQRWNDETRRRIRRRRVVLDGARVRLSILHIETEERVEEFLIDNEAVDEMVRLELLRGQEHWGWSDENELRLSDAGIRFFNKHVPPEQRDYDWSGLSSRQWYRRVRGEPWTR